MKIATKPLDWKDLQNKVGEILTQCNFKVEIEKKVSSTRSLIEIDVYAEEIIDDRKYLVLCECKMWNSNIPQLYIHGLRTVVNDVGANKGYIISTSNFQQGAKDSVENTNVELLTWDAFQQTFFKSWYLKYFHKKLKAIVHTEYDSMAINFFDSFELIKREEFHLFIEKYNAIQQIYDHFPYPFFSKDLTGLTEFDKKLPLQRTLNLEDWEYQIFPVPKEIMEEENYLDFLYKLAEFAKPIYEKLDPLDLHSNYED